MENEKDIAAKREDAVEELKIAFAELESEEGLLHLVGGHGLQSRVFAFEWSDPTLEISIRLPYGCVLSGEEAQREDELEIGAAIRMSILLLTIAGRLETASRISISCDDRGTTYAIYDANGELEDSGTDWSPLVKRLESDISNASESLSIIWP